MSTKNLARIFRAESGQVLASLVYFSRDLQLAEDALQDAFEQASLLWPSQGIPKNTGAWLHVVAKRKLIDRLRQVQSQQERYKLQQIEQSMYSSQEAVSESDYTVPDERLRLIFTCCHPALNQAAQVALTLRTLCGLTVREIARAYLTSEVAMGRRITRAKKKIKDAGIAYKVPDEEQLVARLNSVLQVIYLIYNESYSAYEGQTLTRRDLADEAIRLSQVMLELIPKAEVFGMAALLLFHHARQKARSSKNDSYIPLEDQDRTLWDKKVIAQGMSLMERALRLNTSGPYQIQAAISGLHCNAKNWASTDWQQICLLYQALLQFNPSPIVALNLAVAKANAGHVRQAYQDIIKLSPNLINYQPYYAAMSDLESRLELIPQAISSLDKAIKLSKNDSERDFLLKKHQILKNTNGKN